MGVYRRGVEQRQLLAALRVMKTFAVLVFILLGTGSAWAEPCHYYASPNGRGNGRSDKSPFKVADFWTVARPGTTLCLLDGTYQGADSMITPDASGKSGSSDNPITVKALNDGAVTIDGEYEHRPVFLKGNSYWVLEGFNVKNGRRGAVHIRGSNNIVRRVVAWDNSFIPGYSTFSCHAGTHNLFEDVAAFGIATWHFTHSQNRTGSCTFRRAWGRFEGTSNGRNGATVFGGLFYNALESTCENCIAEYAPNIRLTSYAIVNPTRTSGPGPIADGAPPIPNGLFNINRWDDPPPNDYNGQVLGSVGYVQTGANLARITGAGQNGSGGAMLYAPRGRKGGNMLFKDFLIIVDPSHSQFANTKALRLESRVNSSPSHLTNVSTVAGTRDTIDSYWVQSSVVHASDLAGLNAANANPWTGTVGANLCFRYVNRAKTTTPLWPWPMNERIKTATAAAGSYSGPCPRCEGEFPARRATDVTADIEQLLGTIPDRCKTR
jgi:hypothetical protein